MVNLTRLALQIEASGMTPQDISIQHNLSGTKLREWYEQGTRLVILAAGASFYILIVIAVLNLKTKLLYRSGNSIFDILFLGNILRNPVYSLSVAQLVQDQIIPTIRNLYADPNLSKLFVFPLYQVSEAGKPFCLDFSDLAGVEAHLNDFQTNVFRLPVRSPIWKAVRSFGYPDWTKVDLSDTFYHAPQPLLLEFPDLPPLEILKTSLDLKSKTRLPFALEDKADWTHKERLAAETAIVADSLQDFRDKLESIYESGKVMEGSYVHLPSHVIDGKSFRVNGLQDLLGVLVVSDPTGWLQMRLRRLESILNHLMPETMMPRLHGSQKEFTSLHCDVWNRYVEKGKGAPPNMHPDQICKDNVERVNVRQRLPYCSRLIRKDPETVQALDGAVQEICQYVERLVSKYLPEEYVNIKAFVDVLPLNHSPVSYPFASYVINIQVCTEGHMDSLDDTICVVIPFGQWTNGGLALHEAGMILDAVLGDVVIFPSYRFTHFNLDFSGVRCSLVMFSDKHGKDWVRFRNGWSEHIVVKSGMEDIRQN